MKSTKQMQIGDTVYTYYTYNNSPRYTKGTVAKVTPNGMVTVSYGPSGNELKFNAKGVCPNKVYGNTYLDTMPVAERETMLATHC